MIKQFLVTLELEVTEVEAAYGAEDAATYIAGMLDELEDRDVVSNVTAYELAGGNSG